MTLKVQRCHNHASREAVVHCPECRRFFCRECINEFEDRFLCQECLKERSRSEKTELPPLFHRFRRLTGLCFGLLLSWLIFYWLGQTLYSIPSQFHSGAAWHEQHSD